ncbi:MAG TPA: hypothetical protein VMT16_17155 [Thermoanaerobaculia bacterium]|nr:hypothetical protein [Thermoanaerobaculia bacterium]
MPPRRDSSPPPVAIGLNAVIVAVTAEVPRILVVKRTGHALAAPEELEPLAWRGDPPDALPFGPLDPVEHRTLERGLRSWVKQQTGLEVGYVEQLYTFGDRFRDPRERIGGPRVISAAYLALTREQEATGAGAARWSDAYSYLPWEDWREGRPGSIDRIVQPALAAWTAGLAAAARGPQSERIDIAFGLGGSPWDPERVLDRYELLYEAGLVEETWRDRGEEPRGPLLGRPMALDHRRILATALGRLRGKIKYRPVVFELVAGTFTLLQLQRVVEALAGVRLHKQNFRRLVERGGLVEGTGRFDSSAGGRPAELFRFRREVLRERPAPGVGLPGAIRG